MVTIKEATKEDIDDILPLFNAYRLFYGQPIQKSEAFEFLSNRIKKNESVIFLAYINEVAVGFTQLYPTFSSVSLKPTLILNDLYVDATYRKTGVAKALLNQAKKHCKINSFKGLALETAMDNPAQHLYEKLGWEKDVHCFHYFWTAK